MAGRVQPADRRRFAHNGAMWGHEMARGLRSGIIAAVICLALPQAAHAQCSPASPCVTGPTDIGTLGGTFSTPVQGGISADGSVVVGRATTTGDSQIHAFRWQGGSIVDLGTLGGTFSTATGVSSSGGVVVGYSTTTGEAQTHAFRWQGGTIADLGTLGGTASEALAVNSDGSVVVGDATTTGNAETHAFRWQGGTMADLGTLGGTFSKGVAVSSDGLVVVGYSRTTANAQFHAFRWESNTMADLGTLGGNFSEARAVSADGSVVVGDSTNAGGQNHAFRWQGGTMADLGTFGGTLSFAEALSSDGLVVVGLAQTTGNAEIHAFRWEGGTLADLGTFGGTSADAQAVSSDGSVVVGYAYTTGNAAQHALRWTAVTGTKDLNTLLANAGVNMTGIVLYDAIGVSANGQFITGNGTFNNGTTSHAYIVRYDDFSAGITTPEGLQQSVNDLSNEHAGVMAQEHGLALPLLGDDKPLGNRNEAGAFGYGGSAGGGGYSRFAMGYGLALLAGVAYGEEAYDRAEIGDSFLGAIALRYLEPGRGAWHPLLEAGGWLAPNAPLEFDRTYMNGAGTATGVGNTNGDLSYVFGRAGIAVSLGGREQVVLSGEMGREWLTTDGYAEVLDAANPFNATVNGSTDHMDIAKARLA